MIAQALLLSVILWCCIINSQPTGVFFGIDWRADNLDNTLFWSSLLLLFFVGGMSLVNYYHTKNVTSVLR